MSKRKCLHKFIPVTNNEVIYQSESKAALEVKEYFDMFYTEHKEVKYLNINIFIYHREFLIALFRLRTTILIK